MQDDSSHPNSGSINNSYQQQDDDSFLYPSLSSPTVPLEEPTVPLAQQDPLIQRDETNVEQTDEEKEQLLMENGTAKPTWKQKLSTFFSENVLFLYFIALVMVLARSVDYVLYIRLSHKISNYIYLLASIYLSVGFLVITWPIVWIRMCTGAIDKKQRQIPKYKFIIMGLFDAVFNLMTTIPGAYIDGPVALVLNNSILFVNMITSFFFLRTRYSFLHYVGMLLVLSGIFTVMWPQIVPSEKCDYQPFQNGTHSNGTMTLLSMPNDFYARKNFPHTMAINPMANFVPTTSAATGTKLGEDDLGSKLFWVWVLLIFTANIPAALSNVYKEKVLKQYNLDAFYANGWIAFFQLIFGILQFPVVFIPFKDSLKIQEFPNYLLNGMKCFVGINSEQGDQCDLFYVIFLIFLVFNITYNILILVVYRRASSTLALIASTSRIALSNFLFLVPFIAGEATVRCISIFDGLALIFLILGIIVYAQNQEKTLTLADSKDPLVWIEIKLRMVCSKIGTVLYDKCCGCLKRRRNNGVEEEQSTTTVQESQPLLAQQ